MVPSCAVTTTLITLPLPTTRGIAPDGLPLATVTVFTLMVAVASATVGVTVTDVVALLTASV